MIKVTREEGHYTMKIVKILPKRGNANLLCIMPTKENIISGFYKWNVFTKQYDMLKFEVT